MREKILVAYASKSGFTVPMAEAIGEAISSADLNVDVLPVKEVSALDDYTAVIIGSSIRMGSWLAEAKQFVKDHQAQLSVMTTAIFTTHMLNSDDSAESKAARDAYIAPILEMITPTETAFFTGAIKLSELSFFERTISKMMKAEDEDLRDYDALEAWGQALGEKLAPGS